MCGAVGRRRARESLRGLRNHRHLNAVFVSPDSRANSAYTFVINCGTLQLSIYESDVVHNSQQQNVTADPRFLFRNVLETLNPLSVPVSSLTYQTRSGGEIKHCRRRNGPKGCVLSLRTHQVRQLGGAGVHWAWHCLSVICIAMCQLRSQALPYSYATCRATSSRELPLWRSDNEFANSEPRLPQRLTIFSIKITTRLLPTRSSTSTTETVTKSTSF